MRAWYHVSPHEPCRICDKPDWCSFSADGAWALCRRIDTGGGLHRVDKAGVDYWLYHLGGQLTSRRPTVELPASPKAECADPLTLDLAYRTLLTALPLSSMHRQALRQRGLPAVEILRRRYRTLPLHGRIALARLVVDRCGPDTCARVPGLCIHTQGTRRWWTLADAPGLLIPVRNIDNRIVALKVRADSSGEGPRYTYLSSRRHDGPGPGAPVHVPLHAFSFEAPVRLTEGELKADVTTVLSGVLTIAVPGVSVWRQALPLLHGLQPKEVLLAIDSDWRTNAHVAQALGQAAVALVKEGYEVQVEDWEPALGKGVDDLLAAGHTPVRQSLALAFGAALRGQTRTRTGRLPAIAAEEVPPWR